MSLKGKAKEVLKIIEEGGFYSVDGSWVDIRQYIEYATSNSKTYTPDQFDKLTTENTISGNKLEIEITEETTQIAARRLFEEYQDDLVLLNFASARNPGGGFINGAKAQEEDLTRCSTLYNCLLSQTAYYDANRNQQSMLYTDHIIYSPRVPWFRTRSRDEPNQLFFASVITAPAPNANQAIRRGEKVSTIELALMRRCGQVLGVARDNGHKNIVLGAWGCGVFGNDPSMVAKSFNYWLNTPAFSSAFNKVVFAIYDTSKTMSIVRAFREEFNKA
ncbi:TIGR02452 family protein [Zooshikella sp. RANM57]|uniref:TIGR02452 family protein n=1 Tax=Zooshikella sp. RANM57 TaxID=3425863 RepID=UPI003D6F18AC